MRRTRGLRAANRDAATDGGIQQLPFGQVRNPYPPFEILSAEDMERIEAASLTLLEEVGVNFLLDEAREILREAGADVEPDGPRVRFDRGLITEAIRHSPSEFVLHARNPEKNLRIGGSWLAFTTVAGPPNASDIVNGRRSGNFQDYCDFIRLAQSINIAHAIPGHPVEPVDMPASTRHLDTARATVTLTDKVYRCYSLGRDRVLDLVEITKISRNVDDEQLGSEPSIFTVINANSPMQFDVPMLWGIIELARRRQAIVITPFTLAGAMAPITLAGAIAQQNAEALAGIAFAQIVNPGTPVMYGGFTSNVDMKTGSPAFGTPEYVKATLIGGQFARRYGIPYRSSNVNASNAPDVQATYESQMSIWAAVLGHANLVHHALGWLEGGLCASFEKFIIDAEMLQGLVEVLKPVEVDDSSLALEAVHEVGPGGHFFAASHTMQRYQSEFYQPILSDWRNYETWSEDGSVDATQRAHRIYRELLESYEKPSLDPACLERLDRFVAVRKEQQAGASPA